MNRNPILILRHSSLFLFFLGAMLFVSSCSSEKRTTKSSLRSYTANHLMREVDENSFDYDKLQTKLDIKFKDSKNSLGLKGQLRMQKDSVIWLSLSLKVGIEIGRLMITPDSVMFLNRNNKTYLAESLSVFDDKLPIKPTIDFFQNLLVGNDTQIIKGEKYKVTAEDDKYKLETINKLLLANIWVMPETFKITKYKIKEHDNDKRKIQLSYSDFKSQGAENTNLLPSKILFELGSNNISLEINYSNTVLNQPVEFPFNVTKKFDRIFLW